MQEFLSTQRIACEIQSSFERMDDMSRVAAAEAAAYAGVEAES